MLASPTLSPVLLCQTEKILPWPTSVAFMSTQPLEQQPLGVALVSNRHLGNYLSLTRVLGSGTGDMSTKVCFPQKQTLRHRLQCTVIQEVQETPVED